MSDLASPCRVWLRRWSMLAFGLAVAAVAAYVVAGLVDDGLYAVVGILGVAAFGVGLKGRRDAKRAAAPTWPALAAIVVGGLLGGLVLAFAIAFALSELV